MSFAVGGGEVSAAWDRPDGRAKAIVLLAPGAGGTLDTPQLKQLGSALAERGIAAVRFNFPYSEAGRRSPERIEKIVVQYRQIAEQARAEGLPLYLGGRSFGGRAASMLAAEGFDCAGVVLLAYPLHPPGKPDALRVEHLSSIDVPVLWLQGTRDTFATPSLLRATVAKLPRVTLVEIAGGDHSFRVSGRRPAEVAAEMANAIAGFLAE